MCSVCTCALQTKPLGAKLYVPSIHPSIHPTAVRFVLFLSLNSASVMGSKSADTVRSKELQLVKEGKHSARKNTSL